MIATSTTGATTATCSMVTKSPHLPHAWEMAEIPMNALTASRSAEPTRLPFTKRQMMFAVR